MDDKDYQLIKAQANSSHTRAFHAEGIEGPDGRRWKLTDVVGLQDGLGVECLSGSGAIAGVFSKAFREGLTITLVSGRTVGIGAYLARLGRRCVLHSVDDFLYHFVSGVLPIQDLTEKVINAHVLGFLQDLHASFDSDALNVLNTLILDYRSYLCDLLG